MTKQKSIKCLSPLKPFIAEQDYKLIAFDTEDNSLGSPNNFLLASLFDGECNIVTDKRDETRQCIFRKQNKSTIFIAHNLAYDLDNIDYPENCAERIYAKTKLIGAGYEVDKKRIRFIDTGNFFVNASIHSLGELLKFEKIEFDLKKIKYKQLQEIDSETRLDLGIYCSKDTEICRKAANTIIGLSNENQTRFKSYTAPSMALKIWRTKYLKQTIYCRPKYINDIERFTYYGGRCEVFDYNFYPKIEMEDIVSSYPRAMYAEQYPVPDSYYVVAGDIKNIELEGISLVSVYVPYMSIPPLPYRNSRGKLIFPIGKWTGIYTHPELRMAVKYGVMIEKVHESIIYRKMFNPFSDYIRYFFEKKNDSKGIKRELYKLMMTSLSGKYGERKTISIKSKYSDLTICRCEIRKADDNCICTTCNKLILEGLSVSDIDKNGWVTISGGQTADSPHVFPILIAYITAYGRIKLYEDRLTKCYPLYCDSVTGNRCTTIKYNNLINVVTFEELFNMSDSQINIENEKEIKYLNDIEAITYKDNKPIFRKIIKIIRHKTDKQIVLTTQKYGCSETTIDHSYITQNGEKTPNDMLNNNMISLYDIPQNNIINETDIPNLESVLRLCFAYISDGSVSDLTTSCRYMFSIAKDDKQYLEELAIHFEKVFGFKPSVIEVCKSKRTEKITYALRNGRRDICEWFKNKCGQGASNKYIPSFVYNIDLNKWIVFIIKLLKAGDETKLYSSENEYSNEHKQNHFSFCSSSLKLISGLDLILKMTNRVSNISFREYKPQKYVYTITSSDKWNKRNSCSVINMPYKNQYVYDLEIDDTHIFVDSCGHILLHNTDSCMSVNPPDLNCGSYLGNWEKKTYYNFKANAPKFYTYEYIGKDKKRYSNMKLKGVPMKHDKVHVCKKCVEKNSIGDKIYVTTINDTCPKCGINVIHNTAYKYEKPVKTSEAIRRKLPPNKWIEIVKTIGLLDDKRIKLQNGTSLPKTINEPNYNVNFKKYLELNGKMIDEDQMIE